MGVGCCSGERRLGVASFVLLSFGRWRRWLLLLHHRDREEDDPASRTIDCGLKRGCVRGRFVSGLVG